MIYCDNQSFIKLSSNPLFHNFSKHIEIPFHYIKDMVKREVIQLEYICTNDQTTNVLTKPLAKVKLKYFRERLGKIICNGIFLKSKSCSFVSSILYVMKSDDLSWIYSVIKNYLQGDDLASRDYFSASLDIAKVQVEIIFELL